MFKRRALVPLTCLLLAGCQGMPGVMPANSGGNPVVAVPDSRVAPPKTRVASQIGILHRGMAVTVGMTSEQAFRIFRDQGDTGFEDDALPSGFVPPYRGRSWEGATKGFGVILYQDRIVAAMYHEEQTNFARLQEVVGEHQDRMGRVPDRSISSRRVNSWLWMDSGQVLMVMGFQPTGGKGLQVTVAMGDATVLKALKISEEDAQNAAKVVDQWTVATAEAKNSGD